MYPLIIQNLKKSYVATVAVKDLSFSVQSGEIFGLIGPDGAGKTTTMRIIVTLLQADAGQVIFLGQNVQDNLGFVRSQIGYMPQRFSLYQDLTVEQNLRFFGDLFQVSRVLQDQRLETLYAFSKLALFKQRKAGALSGGMKQKLALSCMLMHEPKVLILDEPTFGVDPVSRNELWQILHQLKQKGTTILVSTPYMEEAAECDRIALMYNGELLALDTPQNLMRDFEYPLYLLKTKNAYKLLATLQQTKLKDCAQLFGEGLHLTDKHHLGLAGIQEILSELKLPAAELIQPSLEDIFLDKMGSAHA